MLAHRAAGPSAARYTPPCAPSCSAPVSARPGQRGPWTPPKRPLVQAHAAECGVQADCAPGPATTASVGLKSKAARKALKQLFKATRKRLETASAPTCAPASTGAAATPVLSNLLSELQTLTQRLTLTSDLDRFLPEDAQPDDCQRRTTAPAPAPAPHHMAATTVAGLAVAAPCLDWDEDAFASMAFPGSGRVLVCQGSKCRAKGAGQVLAAVSALSANSPGIEVVPCKCVGKCKEAAAIRVRPAAQACAVYTAVEPAALPGVFQAHFGAPPPAPDAAAAPSCCVECGQHPHAPAPASAVDVALPAALA